MLPTARALIFGLLLLLGAPAAWSQEADLDGMIAALQDLVRQGRYLELVPLAEQAVAFGERMGVADDLRMAEAYNLLSVGLLARGQHAAAEGAATKALAIVEQQAGPMAPAVAAPLNNLAMIYERQQRWVDAERLLERVLHLAESNLPPDDPNIAIALNNLALIYVRQDRLLPARLLLERALAIAEKAGAPAQNLTAASLNNLAMLEAKQFRFAQAAEHQEQAARLIEAMWGPRNPHLAELLSNLGFMYQELDRPQESDAAYQRAMRILGDTVGPEHPSYGVVLGNLALLRIDGKRYAEAEPLLAEALRIAQASFGAEHPSLLPGLMQLVQVYRATGRSAEALATARRVTAIQRRGLPGGDAAPLPRRQQRYNAAGENYTVHADLLAERLAQDGPDAALLAEAFEVAQLAQEGAAARATRQMAARLAAGSDAFATALRARQDAVAEWQRLDELIKYAISRPMAERDPGFEAWARAQRAGLEQQLAQIDQDLATRFGRASALSTLRPLPLAEAQGLLGSGEALLLYLVGEQTLLFVVQPTTASLHRLPIGREALDRDVRSLRLGLDLGGGRGLKRTDARVAARAFDLAAAQRLGQALIGPAQPALVQAQRLLVVPSGPLERLPLGVLVTAPPERPVMRDADYRAVAWLAKQAPIAILPSVAALSLQRRPAGAAAPRTFIGFGDPLLRGPGGEAVPIAEQTADLIARGEPARPDELRRLSPLPESRGELKAIATALQAAPAIVLLGAAATETRVKQADLARYRVIAFATHGLLAGEFRGVAEPALVLSPPSVATPLDDGLLTASEITSLKLDADLVVLSACNTAAPDGVYDAAGLSGLARAFLYAGSRGLLVSHWAVASDAAAALTTGLFAALARDPSLGVAEALQRSELALLSDERRPEFAHPAFWAPFVMVGRDRRPGNAPP